MSGTDQVAIGVALISKMRIKAKSVGHSRKQRSNSLGIVCRSSESRCLLVDSESLSSLTTQLSTNRQKKLQFRQELLALFSLPATEPCPKKARKTSLGSIGSGLYTMWKIKRSVSFSAPKRTTSTAPVEERQSPFTATQLWDALVSHLEDNVSPGRRRRSFRYYDNCFQGSEAVECLKVFVEDVLERNVERQQVSTLLSRFITWGIMEPVNGPDQNCPFKDGGLYRLTKQHFWRQDEKERTNSLRRSSSIPSMVAGGDTEDSGVASSSSVQSTDSQPRGSWPVGTLPVNTGGELEEAAGCEVGGEETSKDTSRPHATTSQQLQSRSQQQQQQQQSKAPAHRVIPEAVVSLSRPCSELTPVTTATTSRNHTTTESPAPARSGGEAVGHRHDNSRHKRYSEQRAHRLQMKEVGTTTTAETTTTTIKRSSGGPRGPSSLLDTQSLSTSCGDLTERIGMDQSTDDKRTQPGDCSNRSQPVAQKESTAPAYGTPELRKKSKHNSSKVAEEGGSGLAEHLSQHGNRKSKQLTSSREVKRKSSMNKKAYCDLYKKLATSGQFDRSPVAYGDFGALAMKDILWQHFSCSQDSGFALISPAGLPPALRDQGGDSLSQVQVLRYGFV